MGISPITLIGLVCLIGLLVFHYFEANVIQDERESLISLKALKVVQNLVIALVILQNVFDDVVHLTPSEFGTLIMLACLSGEVLGKLYYRRQI